LASNFAQVAVAAFNALPNASFNDQLVAAIKAIQAAGGTTKDIAAAMDTYKVTPQQIATALNLNVADVQASYNSVDPTGPYAT
jgi:hypothetical protein